MKVCLVILAFMGIPMIDIKTIINIKSGKGKNLAAYGFILGMGFIISFLQVIRKAPTSPARIIENIVRGIMG